MTQATDKLFQCKVITPAGTLLDCQTPSVLVPAHDGQLGVLYNRLPMFCQLGLGFMTVISADAETVMAGTPAQQRLIIDGGFTLVASNSLTVIAYEAITKEDVTGDHYDDVMKRLQRHLATSDNEAVKRHERDKIALVRILAGAV